MKSRSRRKSNNKTSKNLKGSTKINQNSLKAKPRNKPSSINATTNCRDKRNKEKKKNKQEMYLSSNNSSKKSWSAKDLIWKRTSRSIEQKRILEFSIRK
jgi:hypothetical protein